MCDALVGFQIYIFNPLEVLLQLRNNLVATAVLRPANYRKANTGSHVKNH